MTPHRGGLGAPGAWADGDGLGWRLTRLGPAALRLVADAEPSAELSARLAAVRAVAWRTRPPALRDLVVGYRALTGELRIGAPLAPAAAALHAATRAAARGAAPQRRVTLPVAYGDGADRADLESLLGLRWHEVVRRHEAATYRVAFLGFTPGFAYLHGLPADLSLPRRPAPRSLPAGAVAIADGRAGVYPSAGPGGWWVLGTTPVRLFDPWRAEPTALLPGDEVRFAALAARAPAGAAADAAYAVAAGHAEDPALTLIEAWPGAVSLQGRPRAGVGHLGMAQAGALDARAFVAAARLAGAPLAAPALELAVPHATLRAERPLTAACTGGGARLRLDGRPLPLGRTFAWPAGAHLEVRPDPGASGAHAVLAVGGGLAPAHGPVGHPDLVGEGSTDTRAGVGGFGRALRAGDALRLAADPRPPDPGWQGRVRHAARLALRLHPGPHGEDEAYAALLATAFALGARDRMGAWLDGPRIRARRPDVASEGVPLGAVQLPADGRPVVLLNDRGRTGGYAVAGIVDPRDLAGLAQARPGAAITFEPPAC
ncbi:MAG: carboxyltransferase domain-containing protein [Trueperaceae bacterium]